jgi:tetratricopeptide (TPR) repeat protein
LTKDQKKLTASVEKYKKAYSLEGPTSPLAGKILALWGETIALIGEISEQIELVYEGQNKILESLDICVDDPEIWRAFGESFNSLGRYFNEDDYRYQAIEQFQQGISLDRTKHELWRAIGATYTEIGVETEDVETLKQALYFYTKAIHLESHRSYYHFEQACCLSKLGEICFEEKWLEASLASFEKALSMQKNAIYLHPDWLFQYAKTLDLYAEFFEEGRHYTKAIEIYSHILMLDPDFPKIYHHLALAHSHLGELLDDPDSFYKSLHFLKLALKHEEDNDQILIDIGVTLINIANFTNDLMEAHTCYLEAESKFMKAAKSGNLQAYYQLACLFSLIGDSEKAMFFLQKAESFNALPPLDDLLIDDWLDHVRSCPAFIEFVHYLEKKAISRREP